MRILKKALPLWGAFFVACSMPAGASCRSDQALLPVQVERVVDGDTLRLSDGRTVRLIGLNAPEMGRPDRPAEMGAKAATQRLRQLVQGADIRLSMGEQRRDHYGRWLGHLWREGRLLSEWLLAEGLAYHIAMPPNLTFNRCLKQAESVAVERGDGLWGTAIWQKVDTLPPRAEGFRLVQGQVSAVRSIRSGWMVELDQRLAIRVSSRYASALPLGSMTGKHVRVRGWLKPRHAGAPAHFMPFFIHLNHPAHFELFP